MVYIYYYRIAPDLCDQLTMAENFIVIPSMIMGILVTGVLTMVVKPESSLYHRPGSLSQYKFDKIIYYPDVNCRTCKVPKPARSKHCNICRQCTLVADHHCLWANNCIGKGNYQYFYSFLSLNSLLLTYGFFRLIFLSSYQKIKSSKTILTFVILCGSFSIICSVFTYLQLAIVEDGMTSNEKDKWFTIQEIMRDGNLVVAHKKWYIRDSEILPLKQPRFYSTNSYDHTVYQLDTYTIIRDASEISNIYDKGSFLENFKDLCN